MMQNRTCWTSLRLKMKGLTSNPICNFPSCTREPSRRVLFTERQYTQELPLIKTLLWEKLTQQPGQGKTFRNTISYAVSNKNKSRIARQVSVNSANLTIKTECQANLRRKQKVANEKHIGLEFDYRLYGISVIIQYRLCKSIPTTNFAKNRTFQRKVVLKHSRKNVLLHTAHFFTWHVRKREHRPITVLKIPKALLLGYLFLQNGWSLSIIRIG